MAEYEEGHILKHPKTGHEIVLRNGEWVDNTTPGKTGVVEDISKLIIPTAVRGTVGAATAPVTLGDVGAKALFRGVKDYVAEPAARAVAEATLGKGQEVGQWFADRNAAAEKYGKEPTPWYKLPTYSNVMSAIENKTGPLYRAQTTPGKYFSSIGEIAPAGIGGAGAKLPQAIKTVLGGAGSEYLGSKFEGTEYEPLARMVGLLGGTALPATARTVVSPLGNANQPFMDMAKGVRGELKKHGGDLPSSVYTGSPTWGKVENALMSGYTPKKFTPERQLEAASAAMQPMAVAANARPGSTAIKAYTDAAAKGGAPNWVATPSEVKAGLSKADAKSGLGKFIEGAEYLGVGKPTKGGSLTDIPYLGPALSAVGGYLGHKLYGNIGGGLGLAAGALPYAKPVEKLVNSAGSAAVMNPLTQTYLRNQVWKPSPATALDPKLAARALAAQAGPTIDDFYYPQ